MTEGIQFEQVRLYLPQYFRQTASKVSGMNCEHSRIIGPIYSTRNDDPEPFRETAASFVAIDFHSLNRKTVSGLFCPIHVI